MSDQRYIRTGGGGEDDESRPVVLDELSHDEVRTRFRIGDKTMLLAHNNLKDVRLCVQI